MSFTDLMIGAVIGVVGYKLGEKVQKIRQERDDSEYGIRDFASEVFENFSNTDGLKGMKKIKEAMND